MQNQILSLTKKFISIESTSDNTTELNRILDLAVSQVKDFSLDFFENEGIKSALIYNKANRPNKFRVILNAHLDVIAAKKYQFTPNLKGSKLYGAGALDMKAGAASLILAFRDIAEKISYPLALQLTTDEEIGGFHGTKYQIEQGVKADFIIAGESTNFQIVNKAKGVLWLKITAKGLTAHGAYPWKGKNAINEMSQFISNLEKNYPIPDEAKWVTTVNTSKIETTNTSFNKIPDNCTALLDIRFIPEDSETILKQIQELLPDDFTIEVIVNESSQFVEADNPYIQVLKSVNEKITGKKTLLYGAHGSSDARHYFPHGGKGIEFGLTGGGIGSDEEWVDIGGFDLYYQTIKDFLLSLN